MSPAGAALRGALACLLLFVFGCGSSGSSAGPARYRLTDSGEQWHHSGSDAVQSDLEARYPAFFRHVLDPNQRGDLDIRPLRRDLEHRPVDRRNFDALNAVAVSYFELNHRAQADPGGPGYFDDSFRAAKLLALPWKAYGLVDDPSLRDAIIDFFEDAGTGTKLDAATTAPRLARIVESLAAKEDDPGRLERIEALTRRLDEPPSGP